MRGNILVIDDEEDWFEELKKCLPAHNVYHASGLMGTSNTIARKQIDVAIMDLNLQGDASKDRLSGLKFIKTVHDRFPTLTIMAISQFSDVDIVVKAIHNGAKQYKWKGEFDPTEKDFREEINQLVKEKRKGDKKRNQAFRGIWGSSPTTQELRIAMDLKAQSRDSFFLVGAPGVGKKNTVQYLYYKSLQYSDLRPFEEIDFSVNRSSNILNQIKADPSDKQRNFLKNSRNNLLVVRHVHLASKEIQRALHYILENKTYLYSHENLLIQFVFVLEDNPYTLIREKRLYEELFYSIDLIEISPLKERKSDIPDQISEWLKEHNYPSSILTEEIKRLYLNYDYPGNSLELFHLLKEMVASHMSKYPKRWADSEILLDCLPKALLLKQDAPLSGMLLEVAKLELSYIERALQKTEGKKGKAADLLGIKSGADNLKKSYIDRYKKHFPGLLNQYPMVANSYKNK